MKQRICLLSFLTLLSFCMSAQRDYTQYVMPLMGTQSEFALSNGNLYPATALPWGMNHWSPQTATKNDERWYYSYNSHYITGIRQTHQPSPWTGDYGVFSLFATVGEKKFREDDRKSWFSHKSETSLPHYYKVYLADYNVTAELTPTERSCVIRFTFPETTQANVVIDAFARASYIKVIPEENKVIGYSTERIGYENQRVPSNFRNYFVIYFDKPIRDNSVWKEDTLINEKETEGRRSGAVVTFSTQRGETVQARISSSFISWEQAEQNLKAEVGGRSFDEVCAGSKAVWNSHLSRFSVENAQLNDLNNIRTFYTCLYRILLFPREFHELDAQGNIIHYSPYNGKICSGRMYTDNGFWDTFRAVHPFFNLFYPTQSKYILEGLANTYKESGWLPEWAAPGHIDIMVGSNSTSVVASAYLNGVKDVDINTLWEGVMKNAFNAHPTIGSVGRAGAKEYGELGYVPNDIGIKESAARTLEYAYADYCIYKLARELNKDPKTIETFAKRSLNYRNLFYPKYNLMAGRNSKGEFRRDFNPFSWGGDFTEGNSWHYSWSVFHDPAGLATLMGGRKKFTAMLDSVFTLPPVFDESYYGQVIHEIREMQIMNFGQYAHGNQPIQHMTYLYDWAGEPWKTQYWTRQIMDRLYRPAPDGYCGDEDNGQTSAWYVFSALGFYPVCPVSGEYALGSPLFSQLVITMEDNRKLTLNAQENNSENIYINKIDWDNKEFNKNYFTLSQLRKGGNILFQMTNKPNYKRGTTKESFPYSFSDK
ncbi:MAG TPA: GH92 family glycosyl hydrolase [Paludibacteraceae bacterium]|nr:GH92 family glycosyl hydrolase [Paludibacteraceae bacterium]